MRDTQKASAVTAPSETAERYGYLAQMRSD